MKKLRVKNNPKDHEKWSQLLRQEGIKTEETIEDVFGIFEDEKLIATGSRFKNIIKCIAVDSKYQGTNVFNELITFLYDEVIYAGYTSCYVYTKESAKKAFRYLGFKELEHVEDKLYFMEKSALGFSTYLSNLGKKKVAGEKIAAIVMNANPFTKGHQYLVSLASKENDVVHVFVLSEDMSIFRSDERIELVKAGVKHLKNVYVHSTSSYMVSAATFPSYFLKEDDDVTEIQARLDARLFKNHIAPALDIKIRYVGSEPYSIATNIYNQALKKEFDKNLQLKIIDRITVNEDIISASTVRKLLSENRLDEVKKYVPEATYEFLFTRRGKEIINQLNIGKLT